MAYDPRSQEEKDKNNYWIYGTTDPKKIEEVKKKKKENRNFWWAIIIVCVVGYMAIGGIMRCAGMKGDPVNSCSGDSDYQYHHTDRVE